jgi:hypothetical protein
MGFLTDIAGFTKNVIQFGKNGFKLKNSSGVAEIRSSGDTDYQTLRAAMIANGASDYDVATLLDIKNKVIGFSFDGASVPSAGTNTGKFGFCHTTGGAYTNNDVIYDTGSALIVLPRAVCGIIVTTDAVTGTVSLNANGLYSWDSTSYVLKGDGSSTDTTLIKTLKVPFDYEDTTVDSTGSIPSGAVVLESRIVIETGFNGSAPTVALAINGGTPLTLIAAAGEEAADAKTTGNYVAMDKKDVGASNAGVARVTVTPDSSSAGAGVAIIQYATLGA